MKEVTIITCKNCNKKVISGTSWTKKELADSEQWEMTSNGEFLCRDCKTKLTNKSAKACK